MSSGNAAAATNGLLRLATGAIHADELSTGIILLLASLLLTRVLSICLLPEAHAWNLSRVNVLFCRE
jgi:hypothetical protein